MRKILTRFFSCLFTISIFISCGNKQSKDSTVITQGVSQDSTVNKWNYKSKKTGEGKYDLIFSTNVAKNWQIYSPNQEFNEKKSASLSFKDSSIIIENINAISDGDTIIKKC